ncbi:MULTISPECIES: hypothetical protein [Achromobacter]|uniref:hypothetical protein n=1 Tax=Achromobacter TaxID=222 RepID=UPI0006C1952E|nr:MULTISPECIES: hypothetical protein [Achromobacter]MCG2599231.1 hypothetical protein [Achromobacter sp.]MCG2603359.1 hypothetical protein [Achromobacter sp.]CAB3888920.1 hypothetical protein LMG26846_03895 [Achromobacter insuavis]CUJ29394.1 Uncharacterised protein [Achromobacter sp. 2789STDY5608621]CUJ86027.1 Uncharacterised protein [Achromobacter sp. 2789STDY5608615]
MRFSFFKALLACLCGAMLSACTTWDVAMMRHKGKPVNDIVTEWGIPDRVYASEDLPIGQLVYQWQTSGEVSWDQPVGSFSYGMNGGTIYERRSGIASCYTMLHVDEKGIVVGGELVNNGTTCKMW